MDSFDFLELFQKFKKPFVIFLIGLVLIFTGVFLFRSGFLGNETKVEVLSGGENSDGQKEITVEIAGEVVNPGVYKMMDGARVDDLLVLSGGFSKDADRTWCSKYLNRAEKVGDGEKIFIPSINANSNLSDKQSDVLGAKNSGWDQTVSSNFSSDSVNKININNASLEELDTLPGIGPVYGKNIIEHRPYSKTSDLLSEGVLTTSVYNKIKDSISVY